MNSNKPKKQMTLEEAAERIKGLVVRYGLKANADLVVSMCAVGHRKGGPPPHMLAAGSDESIRRADSVITLYRPPEEELGPIIMEVVKERERHGSVDDIAPVKLDLMRLSFHEVKS